VFLHISGEPQSRNDSGIGVRGWKISTGKFKKFSQEHVFSSTVAQQRDKIAAEMKGMIT
jgi:hypothetical protein